MTDMQRHSLSFMSYFLFYSCTDCDVSGVCVKDFDDDDDDYDETHAEASRRKGFLLLERLHWL